MKLFDYGWHQTLGISFSGCYLRMRHVVLGCSPEDHSSLENIGQRLSGACLHCCLRRVAVLLPIGSNDFLDMDTTAQYLNSWVDKGLEKKLFVGFSVCYKSVIFNCASRMTQLSVCSLQTEREMIQLLSC